MIIKWAKNISPKDHDQINEKCKQLEKEMIEAIRGGSIETVEAAEAKMLNQLKDLVLEKTKLKVDDNFIADNVSEDYVSNVMDILVGKSLFLDANSHL